MKCPRCGNTVMFTVAITELREVHRHIDVCKGGYDYYIHKEVYSQMLKEEADPNTDCICRQCGCKGPYREFDDGVSPFHNIKEELNEILKEK